jgi:hypothetical protein
MRDTNGNGDGNGNGFGWAGFMPPPETEPPERVTIEKPPAPQAEAMAVALMDLGKVGACVSGPMTVEGPPTLTFILNTPVEAIEVIARLLEANAPQIPIRSTVVAVTVPHAPHIFMVIVGIEFRDLALFIMPFDVSRSITMNLENELLQAFENEPVFAMAGNDGHFVAIAFPGEVQADILDAVEQQLDKYKAGPGWEAEEYDAAVEGFDSLLTMLDITDVPDLAELANRIRGESAS